MGLSSGRRWDTRALSLEERRKGLVKTHQECANKILTQKDICGFVFIAALFTIIKTWSQLSYSLTELYNIKSCIWQHQVLGGEILEQVELSYITGQICLSWNTYSFSPAFEHHWSWFSRLWTKTFTTIHTIPAPPISKF